MSPLATGLLGQIRINLHSRLVHNRLWAQIQTASVTSRLCRTKNLNHNILSNEQIALIPQTSKTESNTVATISTRELRSHLRDTHDISYELYQQTLT